MGTFEAIAAAIASKFHKPGHMSHVFLAAYIIHVSNKQPGKQGQFDTLCNMLEAMLRLSLNGIVGDADFGEKKTEMGATQKRLLSELGSV